MFVAAVSMHKPRRWASGVLAAREPPACVTRVADMCANLMRTSGAEQLGYAKAFCDMTNSREWPKHGNGSPLVFMAVPKAFAAAAKHWPDLVQRFVLAALSGEARGK